MFDDSKQDMLAAIESATIEIRGVAKRLEENDRHSSEYVTKLQAANLLDQIADRLVRDTM